MKAIRRLLRRLASWSTWRRDEAILRGEIEEHLRLQTAENVRAGMSITEARRQAVLKFGSVEAVKDIHRDQRGLPLIEALARDTRHALRRLRRTPAFTAAAIVTLAVGIGANTAVFAVVDTILIRPLSYPQADALVGVWHVAPGLPGFGGDIGLSPSMYFTYREENRTFEHFGMWSISGVSVTGTAEPEQPRSLSVTHGVLDALGVHPLIGRWFTQADDAPGSPDTVMLTWGYWQRRFGGDPAIVGRTLTINSRPHTVIGVMPKEFRFERDPELILAARFDRRTMFLGPFQGQGLARLKRGVTIEQANADVARMLGAWLHAWSPNPGLDFRIFENTGENVFRLTADAVGAQYASFRAQYEYSSRTGSDLNEDLLVQIGEQPAMRHYDVANRNRNKFTGQMDVSPNEFLTLSASGLRLAMRRMSVAGPSVSRTCRSG